MSALPFSIPPTEDSPAPAATGLLAATAGPESTKRALEDLLRARKLQRDAPPLRGEDRRLRPLETGVPAVDALLAGGFPRGQLSELHGPASSGRTGLLLALVARVTRGCGLVALVDPLDRLDPGSAASAGVDLTRLLWLRGPRASGEEPTPKELADASSAVATLAGSGLFELVVLDVAGAGRALRSLPATTWLRLHRFIEETPTALVIVGDGHVACSPGGAALALESLGPRWSGATGPARLLHALATQARAGRHGLPAAEIALSAVV
jgi:hypothetical protein